MAETSKTVARTKKPDLLKALVSNGSLRKSHWGPQHGCLLDSALTGCLDRTYLTNGHRFGASSHAVHIVGRAIADMVDRKNSC
jgi:hypothetical protein